MEAVSECAVTVARRIVAAGALTVGLIDVPRSRRQTAHQQLLVATTATRHAFRQELATALYALTAVSATTWPAANAQFANAHSPLVQLAHAANTATDYLLCDLSVLFARGEHGAAAASLHAVVVLAPVGCDDRTVRDVLRELPRERTLGVVLTQP